MVKLKLPWSHWRCRGQIEIAVVKLKLPWSNWNCRGQIEIAAVKLKLPWSNWNCRGTFGLPYKPACKHRFPYPAFERDHVPVSLCYFRPASHLEFPCPTSRLDFESHPSKAKPDPHESPNTVVQNSLITTRRSGFQKIAGAWAIMPQCTFVD